MNSKKHLKTVSISDETYDRVLFEGNLGKLTELSIVEGDILELVGVNGVLRVSLTGEQLQQALKLWSTLTPNIGAHMNDRREKK
jgi:hypothetical protein